MKSVVLIPFCPFPADTGGKAEMLNHLRLLCELGPCTVVSAGSRPVGTPWSTAAIHQLESEGCTVVLREGSCRKRPAQYAGIAYAMFCKLFKLDWAFGHANPYHRHAFPAAWWESLTRQADLALINYSYWAHLPCACPKAVLLLDLWSDVMRLWNRGEIRDLRTAQGVVAISLNEKQTLESRGVSPVHWCPPLVDPIDCRDSTQIGLVGSSSRFNREGLRWLESARCPSGRDVYVYGGLSAHVKTTGFVPVGPYEDRHAPYQDCGIILMTTKLGMGVQIKGIEALAAGRVIIARCGAMRGLPPPNGAWLEVDNPFDMVKMVEAFIRDPVCRARQMELARNYYHRYLDAGRLRAGMRDLYAGLADVKV